jgi:hypothetical protein
MQKRIKHPGRQTDLNQAAYALVGQSTNIDDADPTLRAVPTSISEYMASIGRKGGKIGGKRRLSTLSDKERKAIASAAAKARWQKKRKER